MAGYWWGSGVLLFHLTFTNLSENVMECLISPLNILLHLKLPETIDPQKIFFFHLVLLRSSSYQFS